MAHVLVLDSLEDIFICGHCKSNYNSLPMFLEHKKECVTTYTDLSKDKSQEKVVVEAAFDTQLGEVPFTSDEWTSDRSDPACALCKKKFKKVESLAAHMKSHEEKPYQCIVCGRCFAHNSYLQRHIMSHKIWPDGNKEKVVNPHEADLLSYLCQFCDTVLSNYVQYRSHLKNHQHLKKFKCIQGECKVFFDSLEEIEHHVSNTHTAPVYTCHICSDSFRSLEDIAYHHKVHKHEHIMPSNQSKQYKCSLCDSVFKKSEKLSLHMLTENHKKVCTHCNKTFTSNKRLRLHLQVHQQLKPYQCTVCNSTFHMKKYLSTHMLRHGMSQFQCAVCKAMFKRQDLLQRHMKLHLTRKLYKCPFKDTLDCKKEFSRSDKLKSHMKIHTKYIYSVSNTNMV